MMGTDFDLEDVIFGVNITRKKYHSELKRKYSNNCCSKLPVNKRRSAVQRFFFFRPRKGKDEERLLL